MRFQDVSFEGSKGKDDSRRGKVLKGVARGIYAILLSVTETESDRIAIWNHLKESGLVEKLLGVGPQMSADLREIVRAYNSAPNYPVRIQILSAIVKNYTYAQLNKFNKEPETIEEDEETTVDIETKGLHLSPPLSRHIYNAANDHFDFYKHGLERIVRKPIAHWRFDLETVNGIIRFVNSPAITQAVAFGSRLIASPSGGFTPIAKVSRKFSNSEVTKQVEAHLVEHKYPEPHPCTRTIMRMLENMKASTTKSLQGICPSHENNSRAFDCVTSILSELKKIPELYDIVPPEDIDTLSKVINTTKIYIKNIFRFQLDGKHSKIRSHCVLYGCSAPDNKKFSAISGCKSEENSDTSGDGGAGVHDGDGCKFCEAIPTMFKVMTGIVRNMREHLLPTQLNQMIYNLQRSEFHIHAFKGYLMRSLLARLQWDEFSKLEKDGQATLVVDFPMKKEPQKGKETTEEWYSKTGYSWFIGVFTRRIKVDGKSRFRSTKYFCVVDQGTEDAVKQDSSMVLAIMKRIIEHYKEANKDITSLFVKSDNASNFKNETVVSFLHSLKIGDIPGEELKVVNYMNNSPGDGKDKCDSAGAGAKDKVNREVNSLEVDADTPSKFAYAMVRGDGMKNSVVMLGPIIGKQETIENKQIPTISKIHDIWMKPGGVLIRRCCKIGEGQFVKIAPRKIDTFYRGKVINGHHLDKDGRPIDCSDRPVEKSTVKHNKGNPEETDEKLTMYQYIRKAFIQSWGMESLQDSQPEVQMGGRILLQKMELPPFTPRLLALAQNTKMTMLNSTLQGSLLVGYALSIWGAGKNPITDEARAFVQALFEKGQVTKPVPAADAVIMMQNKTDGSGVPVFDESSFLDTDQIKSIFGTTSRKRKRSLTDPKNPKNPKKARVGIDFDDEDNGEAKQEFEQQLADYEVRDQDAAIQKDSDQIKEDLEKNAVNCDQHPIKVASVDFCQIAERMNMKLSVDTILAEHTKQQTEAIFEKLEKFEIDTSDEPPPKKRRTKLREKKLIFSYVKQNCDCVAYSFYKTE